MRLFKLLFILLLIATPAFLAAFMYIDHEVGVALKLRQREFLPAVYSEALRVTPNSSFTLNQFVAQLDQRRYVKVDGRPTVAGEYSAGQGIVELITREFIAADGRVISSAHVTTKPHERSIINHTNPAQVGFTLEPLVLAPLVRENLRASSVVALEQLPQQLKAAIIAIEDQRFFSHLGIDPLGISRALVVNIQAGRIVQGGSTLTQQLAKNLFLTPERSLTRKAKEFFAALSLERRLTKHQILELYLNEVYLGQEGNVAIHGAPEAARTFFGKRVEDLSLAESAMLAGLVRAPSAYSPRKRPSEAILRRNLVLAAMREQGVISESEYQAALREKPQIIQQPVHQNHANFFVAALRRELENQVNLDSAILRGLAVFTGIIPEAQACGERAVRSGIESLLEKSPSLRAKDAISALEGGLVSIEPFSGRIRAWVGGREYSANQFDHVDLAKRQAGSTIKPFLYITALDAKLNDYKAATPNTILPDRPLQVELVTKQIWEPENYDRKFRGDVTLRYALENSLNVPAAFLSQRVGLHNFVRTVRDFHVSPSPPAVPSLALGAIETTLLNLTAAYGALANGGVYVAPRLFLSALDGDHALVARSSFFEERVASEAPVFVLNNILQGAVDRGTGRAVRTAGYTGTVAGKTGTSNDTRDAWFVGYSPRLVTGVWVGFDDNQEIKLTGGAAAAPIFAAYMKCLDSHGLAEESEFLPPRNVVFVDLDSQSGDLASANCPTDSITTEVFVDGTQPRRLCRLHSDSQEEVPSYREPKDPGIPERRERDQRRERGFWERIFG